MRCVVPNCENTVGVSFPVEYELQNIWLKSLQITEGVPDVDSFVCLDHFDKNDVEEIVNEGSVERRIHPGAIPRLFPIRDLIEKETEEFLEFKTQKSNNAKAAAYNSPDPPNIFGNVQDELAHASKEAPDTEQCDKRVVIKAGGVISESSSEEPILVPHFQEFQEENLILPSQQYSETQLAQPFHTIDDGNAIDANQRQDLGQDSNVVINENESFLSIQPEFVPQPVFISESEESQNAEVYPSEGKVVFSSDGHQVYISEENQQQNVVTEHDSSVESRFSGIHNIKQENVLDESNDLIHGESNEQTQEEGNEQTQEEGNEHTQKEMDISEQSKKMKQEGDEDVNMVLVEPEHQIQSAPEQCQGEGEDTSHKQTMMEKSTLFESHVVHDYCDPLQLSTDQNNVVDSHLQFSKSSTPPENILMQWFVPDQPNTSTDEVEASKGLTYKSDPKNRIVISYPKNAVSTTPKILHQQILKGKTHEAPLVGKMIKKVETENSSQDACRLCKSTEQVSINILDNIKDTIMVLEAIQLCIHPLEVSLEDPFSKKICVKCFNQLQRYFEFRQNCIRVDVEQKRDYEKAHPLHRFLEKRKLTHQIGCYPKKTHMRTIISPSKLGYRQTEVVTVLDPRSNSKNVMRKVILTPTKKKQQSEGLQYMMKESSNKMGPSERYVRQIISKVNKADDIQVFKLRKSPYQQQNGQSFTSSSTTSSSYAQSSQKSQALPITISPGKLDPKELEALARKPPLSAAKQMKIQEEMKKVIEGKMSKDDICVDQVIVRVISDDENEDTAERFGVKRKKYSTSFGMGSKHQEFSNIGTEKNEVVMLPKGIRVSVPEKFESNKGLFPCFPKVGISGTVFALVDGYLFEYRLCKGKERFLKCIAANCPANAVQKVLSPGKFENRAWVKTSHNHLQSSGTDLKKQMFYYVIKKRMQSDRGLNFRTIYDQICEKDPEVKNLVPLRSIVNEICKQQFNLKFPIVKSFDDFYQMIEEDALLKFQFTLLGTQFYQERFSVEEEGTKAVVFANADTIRNVSHSKLMYVDASFRIDTGEKFNYQLVTVLVWVDDSYYPIMFALVSNRTMEIFKKIFAYLHDTLAPNLLPDEIVTDYEANIYYALGETYLESHIGGSVFYYTQNLYKKICELGLSKELESTSYFRNIYHMLLMLPLLPVNTIMDGLQNIEIQANDLEIGDVTTGIFDHIKEQWMEKVTPDLFCVHRLENRINENVIAPFKKLRDFLMLSKGKTQRQTLSIMNVVEKLIDLENFLQTTYSSENKKSFGRDLSSSQKKNVLKAWQYIESHPKININHFFSKVIGYIKCMENQLWIWGYYKFSGTVTEELINAANFSIVNTNDGEEVQATEQENTSQEVTKFVYSEEPSERTVVLEAVVGPSGEFVISNTENSQQVDDALFKCL